MRKEIQNNSGRHTKFFAKQEGFSKIAQVLAIGHEDQFVHSTAFQYRPNVRLGENSDQFDAPFPMALDGSGDVLRAGAGANHGNVPNVQGAVFFETENGDSVRDQKE